MSHLGVLGHHRPERLALLLVVPVLVGLLALSGLPAAGPAAGETSPQLATVFLGPANTAMREIVGVEGQPVVHPVKLLPTNAALYLIDGGRLLRANLEPSDSTRPLPAAPVMPPDRRVDGVYMHELVDVVPASDQKLVALDKLGNLFAFAPNQTLDRAWRLEKLADLEAPEPYPLYVGMDAYDGVVYVLDSSQGQVWRQPASQDRPALFFPSGVNEATRAVDLAVDGRVYVLMRSGTIKAFISGLATDLPALPAPPVEDGARPALFPRSLYTQAGLSHLYVVDPGARRVLSIRKDQWDYHQQYVYADPGRWEGLRDVSVSAGKLWVLVGTRVFITPIP